MLPSPGNSRRWLRAVADNGHLAANLARVVVEVHKVEFGRIVAQDGKEAIGKRRVGLPRRDGEPLFFFAFESRRLDRERRSAAGAILRRAGEGHRVFVVGDQADDLELVLRRRRAAAAGRAGKHGNFGGVAGLFATGDRVGDGYGIRCRKANVAAQGIGAKGIRLDKRGSFVEAACGVISIEPLLDGRLLLNVVGRNNLLVKLLLLVGELVARGRCVVCAGSDSRATHEPRARQRQHARRARKSCSAREQSAAFAIRSHIVTVFACHCCILYIPKRLPSPVPW